MGRDKGRCWLALGGRRPKKCETRRESQKRKKKERRRLIWNFVGVAEGLAVVFARCSGSVSGVRQSSGQDTRTGTEVHFRPTGAGRKQSRGGEIPGEFSRAPRSRRTSNLHRRGLRRPA